MSNRNKVSTSASADEVQKMHAGLRVNLGLPGWLSDQLLITGSAFRRSIDFVSPLVLPIEIAVVRLLAVIPLRLKHAVIMTLWKFWVWLHKILPAKFVRRGMSDSLSVEAHALGNVIFATRLFPVTVRRARMGLSELGTLYPLSAHVKREVVDDRERGVKGIFLHTAPASAEDAPLLFWVFGGAYIGGDAACNCGFAERFARQLGCDVFLPDHRLFPEATVEDAYLDVCRAYEYIMSYKKPEKVIVFGISSGGGVALRVLQLAKASETEKSKFFVGEAPVPQPSAAVLVGPFVNYTFGPGSGNESMEKNCYIDWLVQQRLVEWMAPLAGDLCGGEDRRQDVSPLFNSMDGLCPICISISEHEACLDQDMELFQKLQKCGNQVQLYTRPYLCHAYQMFPALLPEAKLAEAELCVWMKQKFE